MPATATLDALTVDWSATHRQRLQQGDVLLLGQEGSYEVWSLVPTPVEVVWTVLTDYEAFPEFLPSVVSCRVLEREPGRTVVERRDRRKIGFMPIKVRIVTENLETSGDRIDYRLVKGNLDAMTGSWRVTPLQAEEAPHRSLLVQTIQARASMGPLQSYFFEVFEKGLTDTMADLRREMTRRHGTQGS
ncbi:MAG: SRPBCC family protein [Leptolyngbya sp.]|nr:SRPBCC family protein [Leptolyngbya sp.]